METQTIKWINLSKSQKTKFLEQAKAFLQQQVSEARICRTFADIYKIKV
jgi:hypothetical protein